MKTHSCISGILLAFLAVGCGDDVASQGKRPRPRTPERTTTGVEAQKVDILRSHLHRERGSLILSSVEEINKILSNDLPEASYRTIPLIEKDDEGSKFNVITVTNRGRPAVACGTGSAITGISNRIQDCSKKNADKAVWEGDRYGAAGEATWKLVLRTEEGREMWMDGRTGLVWSDIQQDNAGKHLVNWCKASGNVENTDSVDCKVLGDLQSLCANTAAPDVGNEVKWRLPTRNDFLQADINGLRFVLKKEQSEGLWTATMRAGAAARDEAWVYSSQEGTLTSAKLSETKYVRCIGAAKL